MTDTPELGQLARMMGIETSYWDIFGTFHETTAESRRALLGAMGCDVSSDEAIRYELTMAETRRWRSLLPPVRVIRTGAGAPAVEINVAADAMTRQMHWRIAMEGGEARSGSFAPSALPRAGARHIDGAETFRLDLGLPATLPEGYHRLYVDDGDREENCGLIVAPPAAYRPAWMDRNGRQWGWACHLYGLRSGKDWGVGDFSDLGALAEASHGASVIGINPLHSLFTARPEEASPYSPSSRAWLNPIYIDVTAVDEFADCEAVRRLIASPEFEADLGAARAAHFVDYTRTTTMKMAALAAMYDHFADRHPPSPAPDARRSAFNRFVEEGGPALRRYALFEALQEHFAGSSWTAWPAAFRRPDSPETAAFAHRHRSRVEFFVYVQWLADEQLARAAQRCAAAGMTVGLYRDLAVGANPDGADVWSDQAVYVHGARVGAPPDAFNALGQDWGLPPWNPVALRQLEYEPFVRIVRANMRHAGALRIDHAMAMQHLFWLLPGQDRVPGAYVTYPMDDLLGILALESHRNRCVVIGEDLGTVPEGFRERMAAEAILSYRVLFFERHADGLYRRPDVYPTRSVAIALTHDMPTIRGYWESRDLGERRKIGLIPDDASLRDALAGREIEKSVLVAALRDQNLLPAAGTGDSAGPDLHAVVVAIERFLARTPSRIMLANIDDAILEADQLNLPGTVFEVPNWRRKLSAPIERIATDEFVAELAKTITAERAGVTTGAA